MTVSDQERLQAMDFEELSARGLVMIGSPQTVASKIVEHGQRAVFPAHRGERHEPKRTSVESTSMRVLVFEDNLIWSERLKRALSALGHDPVMCHRGAIAAGDIAIVNLGSTSYDAVDLVGRLGDLGIGTIGHAGHKEKELHALGSEAGCKILATNSELTHHLEKVLDRFMQYANNCATERNIPRPEIQ